MLAGIAGAALAAPAPARAQSPALASARATVHVPADGSGPRVEATYTIAAAAGADTLPLRTPEFAGARATRVEVSVDGFPAALADPGADTTAEDMPATLAGAGGDAGMLLVPVPPAAARGDGEFTVDIRYRVDRPVTTGDGRFDMVVPLVLPDAPPIAAPEDFFTAEVRLPADYAVVEAFPTVPRAVASGDGPTRHTFALQVAPAMLRWRGRIGDPPVVTFGRVVDLATAGVVLLLSVLGYLALRRTAPSDARVGRDGDGRARAHPGSAGSARESEPDDARNSTDV